MKMRISLSILTLLLSAAAAKTNYCSFTSQHVLCNNPDASKVDAARCGKVVSSGVPDSEIQVILQEHNNLRNYIAQGNDGQPKASNMRELEWDDELALIAQAWANTCNYRSSCSDCWKVDRFPVGQLLHASYSHKGRFVARWKTAVAYWRRGIFQFDTSTIGNYSFNSRSADYTQLVWGKTSKVGCGLMVVNKGYIDKGTYVCVYGPKGNVVGAAVYVKGEPCSACPSGTQCSSTYNSLCSSEGSTPSGSTNRCYSDYCSITSQHTLCKHPEGSINAKNCGGVPLKRLVSSAQRTIIVDEHNKLRSKVATGKQTGQPSAANMRQMVWDEELAVEAQALTDQCRIDYDCYACRRVKRFAVGQNLHTLWTQNSTYTTDWKEAVNEWYDEVKDFNPNNIEPFVYSNATARYTQLVWSSSWKVGCGFTAYMSGGWRKGLYACNYGPGGNYEFAGLYMKGTPCSVCWPSTKCSQEYDGLCESTKPDECAAGSWL